jgi:hypothetical protein
LPGGGGRDPDPDMQALNNVAAGNDKVYLMCKEGSTPTNADSIQNRIWLPQIQRIIYSKHPKQHDRIFGAGSTQPVRIIVYE